MPSFSDELEEINFSFSFSVHFIMRSLLTSFICTLLYFALVPATYGQLEEHTWFLGGPQDNTQAGIRFDFNTNEPSPYNEVRYRLGMQENNIIVSNPSSGATIFYSDGRVVIDATHTPMPNGTDLSGSPSAMYGTAIVFDPAGCDRYYLITVQSEDDAVPRKIFYSAIDLGMAGNGTVSNPLGNVDDDVKNVDFTPPGVSCSESIFTIPKAGNTKDSWLLFGARDQQDLFLYEINSSGISMHDRYDLNDLFPDLPSEEIFSVKMDFFPISETLGRLILAPGRSTSQPTYPIASFLFNTETGSIQPSSYELIDDLTSWTYGTTFSPDGTKLYISDYIEKTLNQYNFTTRTLTTLYTSPHNGRSGGVETGPDGKVYWSNAYVINGPATPVSFLSVVTNPNEAGINCELLPNEYAIGAAINPRLVGALPSFGTFPTPAFLVPLSPDFCDIGIGTAVVNPGGSTEPISYLWDNGETTALAENLTSGFHQVTITDGSGCEQILETFIQGEDETINPVIQGDLILCEMGATSTELVGQSGFDSYLWSNGEVTQNIIIDQPGTYTLTVTSNGICTGESTVEVAIESIQTEIVGDTIICEGTSESINLELTEEFESYLWSDQRADPSLTVNQPGSYSVTVTNSNGCSTNAAINISTKPQPTVTLIPNSMEIDYGTSITLEPMITSGSPYTIQWTPSEYLSCDDCPTPMIENLINDQIYEIFIEDNFGCSAFANISISVFLEKMVYDPNIFSPEESGSNQRFTLYGGTSLKEIKKLRIYDRWGELIYEGNNLPPSDANYGWDGRFNGQKVNPSVYTWIAELEFIDGSIEFFFGDITVSR